MLTLSRLVLGLFQKKKNGDFLLCTKGKNISEKSWKQLERWGIIWSMCQQVKQRRDTESESGLYFFLRIYVHSSRLVGYIIQTEQITEI